MPTVGGDPEQESRPTMVSLKNNSRFTLQHLCLDNFPIVAAGRGTVGHRAATFILFVFLVRCRSRFNDSQVRGLKNTLNVQKHGGTQ